MKLVFALLVIGVVVAITYATPTKKPAPARVSTTQKPKEEKKACIKECGADFKPLCAGDGVSKNKSFGSACVLENHNCEMGTKLKKVSDGECPGGGGIRLS